MEIFSTQSSQVNNKVYFWVFEDEVSIFSILGGIFLKTKSNRQRCFWKPGKDITYKRVENVFIEETRSSSIQNRYILANTHTYLTHFYTHKIPDWKVQ